MKFIVGLSFTVVALGVIFFSIAALEIPGRDFRKAECVAAYDKFGTGYDILEKLKYSDAAKASYGKYSDNARDIRMALFTDKRNYLNYTTYRQYSRYISCRMNIEAALGA